MSKQRGNITLSFNHLPSARHTDFIHTSNVEKEDTGQRGESLYKDLEPINACHTIKGPEKRKERGASQDATTTGDAVHKRLKR